MPIAMIDIDGLEPTKKDANYGKNIVLGSPIFTSDVHQEVRDLENKNWISYTPSTLSDAVDYVKTVKLDVKSAQDTKLEIENLVIISHGIQYTEDGSNGIILSPGEQDYFTWSTTGVSITSDDIGTYMALQNDPNVNKNDEWYVQKYEIISDFRKLLGEIKEGGSCVLFACQITDNTLVESIFELGEGRVNIISNENVTTIPGMFVLDNNYNAGDDAKPGTGFNIVSKKTGGKAKSISPDLILNKDGNAISY